MNVTTHPSLLELGDYLVGSLSHDHDSFVDLHLERCSNCRDELDTICSGQDRFDSRLKEIHANSAIDLSFGKNKPNTTLNGFATGSAAPDGNGDFIESPGAISDRYTLDRELGRGGMGLIFAGRDSVLDRDLVFKVLRNPRDPQSVERFIAEARICGNLQHPGIVPIYDLGRLADNRPFFSMRRIEGNTLGELLSAREDFAADQARFLNILTQISQTVAFAHSMQVIHRDLKPDNIMVGAFGEVQVMDWGIAKVLANDNPTNVRDESSKSDQERGPSGGSNATQLGRILGTPAYMSVEQAQGRIGDVDKRSDVFALGAILCEVLTGKSPYWNSDHNVRETLRQAERGDLSNAFRRLDACGTDAELIEYCKKCLAAEPDDRPSDASCVSAALLDHSETVNQRLRQAELSQAIYRTQRLEQRKRRRIITASLLTIACLATVLAVGYISHRFQSMSHENALMREDLRRQRLELAVAQEQDEYDRAMRLAGSYSGSEVKLMLAGFRQVSDVRSARGEALRRLRESGAELSSMDQEFVRRLLEAHIWSVASVDPDLRLSCMTEAERSYRSTFSVFSNWESPGEFPVKAAAESILKKEPLVREVVVDALDDWYRIVVTLPDKNHVEPNWLLNVANQLDQNDRNPTRRKVRDARAKKDAAALRNFARDDGMTDERSSTIFVIVSGLADLDADEPARELLMNARQWFPHAFWLNGRILPRTAADAASVDSLYPSSAWLPPANPDPLQIFSLADSNARAKRYSTALRQYEWLVSSVLGSDRSSRDTNLMHVVQSWFELGQSYAPAMTRFMSLRETCRENVKRAIDLAQSYRVYSAINRVLGKESATAELFVDLDSRDTDSARAVFALAQSSLVKAGQIQLIQKYLDKDESFAKFRRVNRGPAASGRDEQFETLLTFIALKVQNGYKREALEMSLDARRLWPDTDSHAAIERALTGILPHRSPEDGG